MQVTITETTTRHSPSSPFRHSVTLTLNTPDPEHSTTYVVRDAMVQEVCQWCVEQWGESISTSDVRQGNFVNHYEWYRSGTRYWFRTSDQLFAFKLRWQGYEINR